MTIWYNLPTCPWQCALPLLKYVDQLSPSRALAACFAIFFSHKLFYTVLHYSTLFYYVCFPQVNYAWLCLMCWETMTNLYAHRQTIIERPLFFWGFSLHLEQLEVSMSAAASMGPARLHGLSFWIFRWRVEPKGWDGGNWISQGGPQTAQESKTDARDSPFSSLCGGAFGQSPCPS